jgi:hypothetical protein
MNASKPANLHAYSGASQSDRGPEPLEDYRTRVLNQRADAVERRRRDKLEQSSSLLEPSARIRIFERLHMTSLPRNADHPLVAVIAARTALSVEEVVAEQQRRLAVTADIIVADSTTPNT